MALFTCFQNTRTRENSILFKIIMVVPSCKNSIESDFSVNPTIMFYPSSY